MDPMAYYNDNYFDINFKQYHPDDNSLVCQNNTLYYYGEPKVISGMVSVQTHERVNLDRYKLSNLNVNQWKMESYQLFFYIRESVKMLGVDISDSLMDVYKVASKRFIDEPDKFTLNYIIDYYKSLKTIEPCLSDELFEAFKKIKAMFNEVQHMNTSNITEGFKLIYEKLLGEIKQNEEPSSSQSLNGPVRSRHDPTKPKITPISFSEGDVQIDNKAAFISIVSLIILILAIVIGTMTYIFS